MAKKFRHPETGAVVRIELTAEEFAINFLKISLEELIKWQQLIKPKKGSGKNAVYSISKNDKKIEEIKKRVALLKTGMTVKAVKNVEKTGFLDAYAELAEDCPKGITVHVWRSYGLVVFIQTRYGKMINAEELASRAKLTKKENGKVVPDVSLAKKHLRVLIAMKCLEVNLEDKRWEHQGLPKSWADKTDKE